ncbi:hypothetical protein ACH35V_07040 [Actinomadura sp. 1N219]|uniref:hypothetical protein n=1 Tax=Actinomadura sp. 1N219 TaxID=3375152 RepID=UPI003796816F
MATNGPGRTPPATFRSLPPQAEVKAAMADVECKYRVNLLGVMFAVESEYQNAAIEENAEALADLKKRREEQLRKFRELLKRNGG